MPRRAPPCRILPSRLRATPVVLLLVVLAACSSEPPRVYAPLRYDYLLPIRLNVASITVENRFVPGGPGDLNGLDPTPLVPTLTAMAQDRLQAVGSSGRAVFVIKDATLARTAQGVTGSMDVELDVYAGGGTRAAFAEARVLRTRTGDLGDMRQTLYDMTKQLMDAMNVEFEYQVRHSLHDWLAQAPGVPAPVQQQALPPPGSSVAAPPAAPAPATVPSYAPPSYAPPSYAAPPASALPAPVPYPSQNGAYPPTTTYLPANPYTAPRPTPSPYAAPSVTPAPTTTYPTTTYPATNPYAQPTPLLPPRSP
jgi:hypothetical protein